MYLNGEKESIRRPRVRHIDTNGQESEVQLESYRAASSQSNLFDEIVALVGEGMSQRGVARTGKEKSGIGKSTVSRMWEEKSREQLAQFRERPLDDTTWLAIMIDGVFIGDHTCVVIALGIDPQGNKQMLDFEPGSSESKETVTRLIGRLNQRKVLPPEGSRLLVVRDWL